MHKLHLSQVDKRKLATDSLGTKLTKFLEKRILAIAAIVFTALAAWYYLPDYLFSPPFGIHYIRQTDSLAFARYFYIGNGTLFQPGVLDLNTGPNDGRTAGEFPIMYLIASFIDKTLGHPSNSLRLVHLIIVIVGHCVFVRGVSILTRQPLLSLGIGCCMLGSSVVAYYSCNFLPDPASFGLAMFGWGLFLVTIAGGRPQLTLSVLISLTLAGLIKATGSMHLMTIGAIHVIQRIRERGFSATVSQPMTAFLIAGILSICAWHYWVVQYNSINQANYFLTAATPIWSMSMNHIRSTADLMLRHWWTDYLHPSMWHALLFISLLILLKARVINKGILMSIILLTVSSAAYVLLFFEKFADHDYYALQIMPLVGILLIAAYQAVQAFQMRWLSIALILGVWALAFASISLGHHDLQRRSHYGVDSYSRTGTALLSYKSFASPLPTNARVIILGDKTPNGALSAIGRQGWSFPGYPIAKMPDIPMLIRNGATHVLVISPETKPAIPLRLIMECDDYSLSEIIRSSSDNVQ